MYDALITFEFVRVIACRSHIINNFYLFINCITRILIMDFLLKLERGNYFGAVNF